MSVHMFCGSRVPFGSQATVHIFCDAHVFVDMICVTHLYVITYSGECGTRVSVRTLYGTHVFIMY